jgi:iron complex transport system substrate-binding protein
LVDAAGGQFVGTPAHRCSAEEVAALDPEIVIAAWCGAGDRVPLEKIIAGRGWAQTSAGRSGRVFCIRDEFLNTPAPTVLAGLDALAWAIHPEIFPRTRGIQQITGVPAAHAGNYRA